MEWAPAVGPTQEVLGVPRGKGSGTSLGVQHCQYTSAGLRSPEGAPLEGREGPCCPSPTRTPRTSPEPEGAPYWGVVQGGKKDAFAGTCPGPYPHPEADQMLRGAYVFPISRSSSGRMVGADGC